MVPFFISNYCCFYKMLTKSMLAGSTGIGFVPHVLNVNTGEVKYFKICSFLLSQWNFVHYLVMISNISLTLMLLKSES